MHSILISCCLQTSQISCITWKNQTLYLPLLSLPFGTRCPCPGTRWSTDGLWSRRRCLSSELRAPCFSQRGPSHPDSATLLGRTALTSACTKPCSPGWTETAGQPEGERWFKLKKQCNRVRNVIKKGETLALGAWDGWCPNRCLNYQTTSTEKLIDELL